MAHNVAYVVKGYNVPMTLAINIGQIGIYLYLDLKIVK
jgi:hypothetical protein